MSAYALTRGAQNFGCATAALRAYPRCTLIRLVCSFAGRPRGAVLQCSYSLCCRDGDQIIQSFDTISAFLAFDNHHCLFDLSEPIRCERSEPARAATATLSGAQGGHRNTYIAVVGNRHGHPLLARYGYLVSKKS